MIDWTSVLNTFIGSMPLIIAAIAGLLKIFQIEKNTNSMKDALVAVTKAKGEADGQARGEAIAAKRQIAKEEAHAEGVADQKMRETEQEPLPVKVIADASSPVPVKDVK